MGTDHHCRWVRHRLPLLAGGELAVDERRRVERHLIGCLDCRDRRDASTDALSVLRSFAEESPVSADAPSLWPALAAQIRESRHVTPRLPWWEGLSLPRPLATLGLALVLGGVAVLSLARPARQASLKPSIVKIAPAIEPKVAVNPSRGALSSGSVRPSGSASLAGGNPFESPSSTLPLNYDLDHGTPMGPGNLDPQRTF